MFLKSDNILKQFGAYGIKIIKFNKVNFKKRVRGGCKHPLSRPRLRIKNPNFPHTRAQLNRLFPIKFGVGAVGSDGGGFCCHV